MAEPRLGTGLQEFISIVVIFSVPSIANTYQSID